jgi:ribosomal protein L40E
MPIVDITEFDFSGEHALGADKIAWRAAVVMNMDPLAVLHVGVKSPVSWLDLYPAEFALAPTEAQGLTVEFRPERAGQAALAPVQVSLFGQYLAIQAGDAAHLLPDVEVTIAVIPPLSNCPHCAADLPEGVRECRRCGERIRLCPICGTPNTWIAKTCRMNPRHVIRTESDWRAAPGGDATHALTQDKPLGAHLARRWSFPAFPPSRAADTWEWSAPLAAFGLVMASAIDSAAGRATIYAFELATGGALWDFDLPDSQGIYPDRGAMALSEDGLLYAVTLCGSALAMDAIRGTRVWETKVTGSAYGGVTVADETLLVPAGDTLAVLDRMDGRLLRTLPVSSRLDTAPAFSGGLVYTTGDDHSVYAFDLLTGERRWKTETDGPYNAALLVKSGVVYAATMAGTLYALDALTGAVHWRTNVTSKPIAVTPALSSDGLLFAAADDGFLHIVAASTGNLIRSQSGDFLLKFAHLFSSHSPGGPST